jgi:cytochrome c-type biogenesis protein CcmH/NrfG
MANESVGSDVAQANWQTKQVYVMAAVCLVVGLAVGYLIRGSGGAPAAAVTPAPPHTSQGTPPSQMPTLEQMKHMADKQAEPLLAQLKANSNNAALLIQVGDVYKSAHQFKEAADYYGKSLEIDPKNVAVRTDMASCIFYSGDADGALAQLDQSLKYDPNDVNTLFNVGMIKWRGKKDSTGALAAWQELLAKNPNLDSQKKAAVEKLIAEAKMKRNPSQ